MDSFIRVLKIVGNSDFFLGLFLIVEGLCLILAQALFPVCVVISILIAFTFAIEWFFDIIRHRRNVWSVLQQICILIILILLIVYCFLMIFDERFNNEVIRVIVSATTIADGIKNLIRTIKDEKAIVPRVIFIILNAVCINYGIVFIFLGGAMTNFFTTTMHGVVFIYCGLTDLWLFFRGPKYQSIKSKNKKR